MGFFKKLLNPLKAAKMTAVNPTKKALRAGRKAKRKTNALLGINMAGKHRKAARRNASGNGKRAGTRGMRR